MGRFGTMGMTAALAVTGLVEEGCGLREVNIKANGTAPGVQSLVPGAAAPSGSFELGLKFDGGTEQSGHMVYAAQAPHGATRDAIRTELAQKANAAMDPRKVGVGNPNLETTCGESSNYNGGLVGARKNALANSVNAHRTNVCNDRQVMQANGESILEPDEHCDVSTPRVMGEALATDDAGYVQLCMVTSAKALPVSDEQIRERRSKAAQQERYRNGLMELGRQDMNADWAAHQAQEAKCAQFEPRVTTECDEVKGAPCVALVKEAGKAGCGEEVGDALESLIHDREFQKGVDAHDARFDEVNEGVKMPEVRLGN